MKVCASGFYAWLNNPSLTKNNGNHRVESMIKDIFMESKASFGSRRLSKQLKKEGFSVGRYQTSALMKKLNLTVRKKKKYVVTTDSKHNLRVSENILNRQFNPSMPNKAWTTDITYLKAQTGWVYLAVVIDLHSRQIIGWHVDDTMTVDLCKQALLNAYWQRKPPRGLIHHSDRGSQYSSEDYQFLLKSFGMISSMSRKGNCWDNSPTERFFRSLKYERLNWINMKNKEVVRLEVTDYISWYNSRRLHSSLGYKTPFEFENEFLEKMA